MFRAGMSRARAIRNAKPAERQRQAVSALAMLTALAFLRVSSARVLALLPPCPIHHLTGLLCPGCGGTRALLALLHGDLLAAWHFNPLLLLLAPFLSAYTIQTLRRDTTPPLPLPLTGALLILTLSFTIARNL